MFENPLLRFFGYLYELIIKVGGNFQSLFLLWMRLTWGHQFYLSGSAKLHNMEKTIQFFTTLQLPYPELHAYVVGWIELVGGLLLFIGLASRLVSIPLICVMIGALATAHAEQLVLAKFITEPANFVTMAPYPFLITSVLVFLFGPGRISLDALIKHWAQGQPKF
jgi:putative oxidoreductase